MVCKITDKTCNELFIDSFYVKPGWPCWCPRLILQELNSILIRTFSFVLSGKDAHDHVSENTLSPSLAIKTAKNCLKFLAAKNTS